MIVIVICCFFLATAGTEKSMTLTQYRLFPCSQIQKVLYLDFLIHIILTKIVTF